MEKEEKERAISRLTQLIRLSAQRFPLPLFDYFWRHMLHVELPGGSVPGVGVQAQWATYFEKEKFFLQNVNVPAGCEPLPPMLNATWRSAADRRRGAGDTTNLVEGRNSWLKLKAKRIATTLFNQSARPQLPSLLRQLEAVFEIDAAQHHPVAAIATQATADRQCTNPLKKSFAAGVRSPQQARGARQAASPPRALCSSPRTLRRDKPKQLYTEPDAIDPTLIHGNPTLTRHSGRGSARHYAEAHKEDQRQLR